MPCFCREYVSSEVQGGSSCGRKGKGETVCALLNTERNERKFV